MPRFSVPTDTALFREFDKRVPHGIKATVVRGLIRAMLASPSSVMWAIVDHENSSTPSELEVKEKS